jgi:hypothetical protein
MIRKDWEQPCFRYKAYRVRYLQGLAVQENGVGLVEKRKMIRRCFRGADNPQNPYCVR